MTAARQKRASLARYSVADEVLNRYLALHQALSGAIDRPVIDFVPPTTIAPPG